MTLQSATPGQRAGNKRLSAKKNRGRHTFKVREGELKFEKKNQHTEQNFFCIGLSVWEAGRITAKQPSQRPTPTVLYSLELCAKSEEPFMPWVPDGWNSDDHDSDSDDDDDDDDFSKGWKCLVIKILGGIMIKCFTLSRPSSGASNRQGTRSALIWWFSWRNEKGEKLLSPTTATSPTISTTTTIRAGFLVPTYLRLSCKRVMTATILFPGSLIRLLTELTLTEKFQPRNVSKTSSDNTQIWELLPLRVSKC